MLYRSSPRKIRSTPSIFRRDDQRPRSPATPPSPPSPPRRLLIWPPPGYSPHLPNQVSRELVGQGIVPHRLPTVLRPRHVSSSPLEVKIGLSAPAIPDLLRHPGLRDSRSWSCPHQLRVDDPLPLPANSTILTPECFRCSPPVGNIWAPRASRTRSPRILPDRPLFICHPRGRSVHAALASLWRACVGESSRRVTCRIDALGGCPPCVGRGHCSSHPR